MTEGPDDQKRLAAMLVIQSCESTDYLRVSVIFGQLSWRNQDNGVRVNSELLPPFVTLLMQAWSEPLGIDPNGEQRRIQFFGGKLLRRRYHIVAVDYQMIDQS